MTDQEPELIEPRQDLEDAYLDYLRDFEEAGEGKVGRPRAAFDFGQYLRRVRNHAIGVDLANGLVPYHTYWLFKDGRILGECSLRHRLTEALEDYGGNIGYAVRPSERGKGYATLMLGRLLERAREGGLRRVLITCDQANTASVRVIQKNGGVLDSETYSARAGRVTRRYWIHL